MGLLLPNQIKELRLKLNLTQDDISDLLKLGEKTYTLWETGRGRPSQSMNLMLRLLWEGRLSIADLMAAKDAKFDWPTCQRSSSNQPAVCLIKAEERTHDEPELLASAA